MHVLLALEDIGPNPACFSSAATAVDAIAHAPQRITEYFSWLSNHGNALPAMNETIEVEVIETFHSRASREDPQYIVNAFFEDNLRPVAYWDAEVSLRLLD